MGFARKGIAVPGKVRLARRTQRVSLRSRHRFSAQRRPQAYENTDWPRILELYDPLYELKPTPIVAQNRALAEGRARAPEMGPAGLEKITDVAKLGEFHRLAGHSTQARNCFERALKLARNPSEPRFLQTKLAASLPARAAR